MMGQTAEDEIDTPEKKQSKANLQRIVSQKAFQFGADSGVTAEFIMRQASQQMIKIVDDLTTIITTLQYTLNPSVLNESIKPLSPGMVTSTDSDLLAIKDSIASLILGPEFKQFTNPTTGKWENSEFVILNFQQMFEDRIKYLFMVE